VLSARLHDAVADERTKVVHCSALHEDDALIITRLDGRRQAQK
jgi:hypothetical protein